MFTCKDCSYFQKFTHDGSQRADRKGNALGWCTYSGPSVLPKGNYAQVNIWPEVSEDIHGCRNFDFGGLTYRQLAQFHQAHREKFKDYEKKIKKLSKEIAGLKKNIFKLQKTIKVSLEEVDKLTKAHIEDVDKNETITEE